MKANEKRTSNMEIFYALCKRYDVKRASFCQRRIKWRQKNIDFLLYVTQVTIHDDSLSIADSVFNVKSSHGINTSQNLNGRYSKQSSLSIHSGIHSASACNIKASPVIATRLATGKTEPEKLQLPRQESSFTQEEIYR